MLSSIKLDAKLVGYRGAPPHKLAEFIFLLRALSSFLNLRSSFSLLCHDQLPRFPSPGLDAITRTLRDDTLEAFSRANTVQFPSFRWCQSQRAFVA